MVGMPLPTLVKSIPAETATPSDAEPASPACDTLLYNPSVRMADRF
jgi:hypothetical protein